MRVLVIGGILTAKNHATKSPSKNKHNVTIATLSKLSNKFSKKDAQYSPVIAGLTRNLQDIDCITMPTAIGINKTWSAVFSMKIAGQARNDGAEVSSSLGLLRKLNSFNVDGAERNV